MNIIINRNYEQTVKNFPWNETHCGPSISDEVMTSITTEVFNKIVAADAIKPTVEKVVGRSFSLAEICYLVVQDQDKKLTSPCTVLAQIQTASKDEAQINVAHHVFKKLSEMFVRINSSDLKDITLLFGIQKISQAANNSFSFPNPQSIAQQMENDLTKLIALRSKYNINNVPDAQKEFLKKVDAEILEKTECLKVLKATSEKC